MRRIEKIAYLIEKGFCMYSYVRALALIFILGSMSAFATGSGLSSFNALTSSQPLPVEQAFVLENNRVGSLLELRWKVAPAHYLYKDKVKVTAGGRTLKPVQWPQSESVTDQFFGKSDIYKYQLFLDIQLPSDMNGIISVEYTGCAEAGLCYPPVTVNIDLSAGLGRHSTVFTPLAGADSIGPDYNKVTADANPSKSVDENSAGNKERTKPSVEEAADHMIMPEEPKSWLWMLGGFFVLGLGLAFTPCVFPMYPILSSIIVGNHSNAAQGVRKAAWLSFLYIQGMALAYASVGLVIASLGVYVQAYLQHPAVLVVSSALFVVLACSMFGWIHFSLPQRWQDKVNKISSSQSGGNAMGVFMMGVLSGLIASPCTTAPLSAVLLYVAQSGDLVVGFVTLYVLSLGMGLPLFIIGSSGGKFLPKAGAWMNTVKNAFGFILLLVPLFLLERIVSSDVLVVLVLVWVLSVVVFVLRLALRASGSFPKISVLVISHLVIGVLLHYNINYWSGNIGKTKKIKLNPTQDQVVFKTVESLEQLELEVSNAKGSGILVDLYADWCVACKEFEHFTFPHADVQRQMSNMSLIKVDVTKMSESDKAIMSKYNVLGLPTLMIFDKVGKECTSSRVAGFMKAEAFSHHLEKTSKSTC